jgi:hypothetical protein
LEERGVPLEGREGIEGRLEERGVLEGREEFGEGVESFELKTN